MLYTPKSDNYSAPANGILPAEPNGLQPRPKLLDANDGATRIVGTAPIGLC